MALKEKPFKFVVRLPISLRNKIAEASQYYRRSMNSEIVARLEQSFSGFMPELRDEDAEGMVHPDLEAILGRPLSEDEEHIVRAYRRLPKEKRAALLELLT